MLHREDSAMPSSLSLAAAEKPQACGLLDEGRSGLGSDQLETAPSLDSFLHEHAISASVGRDRYVRYERGELAVVAPYFTGHDEKIQRNMRTVVGQQGGFVILRRGCATPLAPQLRPDDRVILDGGWTASYHPSDPNAPQRIRLRNKKGGLVKDKNGQTVWVYSLPAGQRERHILKHHAGENVEGLHFTPPRGAKYVLPPGDKHAKRLDVPNPEAVCHAARVFFSIEGSLKLDAIRSAGEAAIGTASVTTWRAPELGFVLRALGLRGKQVVIVPDADWFTNPMVVAQAMLCREHLRAKGLDAVVAASPCVDAATDEDGQLVECECTPFTFATSAGYCPTCGGYYKGVDDFLRAAGTLDNLAVLEREARSEVEIRRAVCWDYQKPWHERPPHLDAYATKRVIKALRTLPLFADGNGQLEKNISMLARMMSCNWRTAVKALMDLEYIGLIEVEGSLDAGHQYQSRKTGTWHDFDWNERPRITILPNFRATNTTVPLRERPAMRQPDREVGVVAAEA